MPERQSRLLTLVFTDLVDSTALKTERGDVVAGDLVTRHRTLVTQIAGDYSGQIIDWAGDGCFLTFETPSAAVSFALALQAAHSEDRTLPQVRIGVNVGEVLEWLDPAGSDGPPRIQGLAVDLAARIQSLALPGQVLMTSSAFNSARQLLDSREFDCAIAWLAHGPYLFKGIDGALDVFEAGLEGGAPLEPPQDSEKAHRAVLPDDDELLGWRPATGLAVPRREHWILASQLGEGGYGEVWLAVHEKTKAKRIFKFCFEPDRVRGLKREVVLFRLLRETLGDRDDIAQVLEWEFEKPPYFIEAEYTEAGDLRQWAEEKGGIAHVPLEQRLELVAQTAVALGAAHSVGVLHKDIKPANILISESREHGVPRASLTDFGIGLITDPRALLEKGITAVGLTETLAGSKSSPGRGTRMYMAPELIEGKPATTLSDLYALGVMLYQVTVGDFSRALASGWERDVEDELLREDIAACVDGTPERRIQSASELAEHLRSIDNRRAARVAEHELREEAHRARENALQARRRRRQLYVVVAIAVVLFIFSAREAARLGMAKALQRDLEMALYNANLAWTRESAARAEAEKAQAEAEVLRGDAEYDQYRSNLQLAIARLEQGPIALKLAKSALANTQPEMRQWEWGYLVSKAWNISPKLVVNYAADYWHNTSVEVLGDLPASNESRPLDSEFDVRQMDRQEAAINQTGLSSMLVSLVFDGIWSVQLHGEYVDFRIRVSKNEETMLFSRVTSDYAVMLPKSRSITIEAGNPDAALEAIINLPRLQHDDAVLNIWFSPDESRVITSSKDGTVKVWKTEDASLVYTLAGFQCPVPDVAFSADGTRMTTTWDDHSLKVWDFDTGLELEEISGPANDGFQTMRVSPNLKRAVNYNPEGRALVWDTTTGKELCRIFMRREDIPLGAAFSPDGGILATYQDEDTVQLWDAATGEELASIDTDELTAYPIAFRSDGIRISIPRRNGKRLIVSAGHGDRFEHDDLIYRVSFSRDGTKLATASYDKTAKIWDMASARLKTTFKGHTRELSAIQLSPDGTRALSVAWDDRAILWDTESGRELLNQPAGIPASLRSPAVPQSETVLRNAALGTQQHFSPDGARCIFSTPGGARVVNTATGEILYDLPHEPPIIAPVTGNWVYQQGFSPDGRRLFTHQLFSAEVYVWNAESGEKLYTLKGHTISIRHVSFSPDNAYIATSSPDKTAKIWDAETGDLLQTLSGHTGEVMSVRFSPDSRLVVTASYDLTARIWDVATGESRATLAGHTMLLTNADFSPDGKRVLTTAPEGENSVKVWDLQGHELLTLATPDTTIHATWSPDGTTIVTASDKGEARLWKTIPWNELATSGGEETTMDERLRLWSEQR